MTNNENIRVMIVDDHDMVRIGLRVSIEKTEGLVVVGEASGGDEAVEKYHQLLPDVVLMDLLMPQGGGIDATKRILQKDSDAHILALTSYHDDTLINSAIQSGVTGYLLKDISMRELALAIRNASEGQSTLSQEATKVLMRSAKGEPEVGHDLTMSELRILKLVAKGLSNNEIAQDLVISVSTVKKHVSNILSKLGVSNRAEATGLAIQNNFIDIDSNAGV